MPEDKPDDVIIQVGCNDLPTKATVLEIANHIVEAGTVCCELGAKRIMVSSVLPRADFHLQLKRQELNKVLESLCDLNNFVFIHSKTLVLSKHICYDGVHLNDSGSKLLQDTFLEYLNLGLHA